MKVASIFKAFVFLSGVIQESTLAYGSKAPCVEIDGRVQCAAAETFSTLSLDYFAAYQHHSDFPIPECFIKKGENFESCDGSPKEIPNNSLTCEEAVYLTGQWSEDPLSVELISENQEPRLKESDCASLKKAIVSAHARTALLGMLPKENPYSEHLAWKCDEDCGPIGNLAQLNGLSEEQRKKILNLQITTCLAISSKKTEYSNGLYQTISATVFGTIPEKINNICINLLEYYYRH